MDSFPVGLTEVAISGGLPKPLLPRSDDRQQAVILTQPGAAPHAVRVAQILKGDGLSVDTIELPDREEAKSIAVVTTVFEQLAGLGLTRGDTIVGVGGGSVTDVAGFVAGTWMRGIEVVHVPTTLLAAVDASVGGKTGINLGGKNLVGVFWEPSRVLIDLEILNELPKTLIQEGMAEALKAGAIGDTNLMELIESHGPDAPLDLVVPAALRVKARYVEEDLREGSSRAVLNFGHTIGHAVEFISDLSHGTSVGIGMVAAAAISEPIVGFTGRARLTEIVAKLGLRADIAGLDRTKVIDQLLRDKKRDNQGIRMVLLRDFADPVVSYIDDRSMKVGLDAIGL